MNEALHPAMVTIAAAVSAIDGFAAVADSAGVGRRNEVDDDAGRAVHVWEILRAGFEVSHKTNQWPADLKEAYRLRSERTSGGLLHPKTIFGAPVKYPLVEGVTPARATYTLETAERVVALMQDIFGTCKDADPDGSH